MEFIPTTKELEVRLGNDLKELRLQKNIDRQTLCNQAGVSKKIRNHIKDLHWAE